MPISKLAIKAKKRGFVNKTGADLINAAVVKVDAANDLALLKANAEGRMQNAETFRPLPIAASRTVKLGGTVATVGQKANEEV